MCTGKSCLAHNLYSILLSCTEDDAFRICHSVKGGNGLEAVRLLMKRYEPRTPGTKRALLKAIINNPASKKLDELEKNLMKVEEFMKHYEVMAGADMPEDLKVTVIIDLCTKDLKYHLELSTREMTNKPLSATTSKPWTWTRWRTTMYGGAEWSMTMSSGTSTAPRSSSTCKGWNNGGYKGYPKGGSNGSFNDLKDVSKGDDSKGGPKGDGQGKGGKGSGFNGYCHWCGEWGHSQSRCRQKDDYMKNQRKNGKSNSKGGYEQITHNVEKNKNHLENLEKSGGYRCLSSLEHRGSRCVTSNRFASLQELKPEYQKKTKGRKVNQQTCFGDSTPCTRRATRMS